MKAWESPDWPKVRCAVCNTQFEYGDDMSPMLKDDVWAYVIGHYGHDRNDAYSTKPTGLFICYKCMQKALGRSLTLEDLNGSQFNDKFIARNLIPDKFEYFLNVKQYTDVRSYGVWNIHDGKARAIEVEKHIKPVMVPGGFSAVCLNNDDFSKTEEVHVVSGAEPIDIQMRKGGVWGHWEDCSISMQEWNAFKDPEAILDTNPTARKIVLDGHAYIAWYLLTPKGKPRRRFVKLGIFDKVCRYYYDYNF